MDFGREDLPADNGDPQLQPLRDVGLENYRAVLNRRRIADVAPGDDLGIADKDVARGFLNGEPGQLADNVAVVLLVEVQELVGVIREQSGRQLQAQLAGRPELRS